MVSPSQLSDLARRPAGGFPWAKTVGALVTLALIGGTVYLTKPWEQLGSAAEDAIRGTTPVSFEAGSSPAEMDDAFALCQQTLGGNCSRSDYEDETLRTVTIGPTRFDPHEVTNRDFAAWVSETRYETTAEQLGYSWDPLAKGTDLSWRAPTRDASHRDRSDHPVVHVSGDDAAAYCEAQGKRLPTGDEWEYAARGAERRIFPWGDTWANNRAVWKADGTQPVSSLPGGESWNGLHDMAGNVWEWTSTVSKSGAPIVRGGSWFEYNAAYLRGAMQMELEENRTASWSPAPNWC